MTGVWRVAGVVILLCSTLTAVAQTPPGPSPVAKGTSHSSPESPDKPKSWVDGQPPATNPSTNELAKQPSGGGRDPDGSDPSRPGAQGSEYKRG